MRDEIDINFTKIYSEFLMKLIDFSYIICYNKILKVN